MDLKIRDYILWGVVAQSLEHCFETLASSYTRIACVFQTRPYKSLLCGVYAREEKYPTQSLNV